MDAVSQLPQLNESRPFHAVVFVCSQNICRSVAAEAVFAYLCNETGLPVRVSSAGVHASVGDPPVEELVEVAERRGYNIGGLRSRPLESGDFDSGVLLVAADRAIEAHLAETLGRGGGAKQGAQVTRLGEFAQVLPPGDLTVPGDAQGARTMFARIEDACLGLLHALQKPQESAARPFAE